MTEAYVKHVRHPHAWTARYAWCGKILEPWDKTPTDGDGALVLLLTENYHQPCLKCVNRMRKVLEGKLVFDQFVTSLGDQYVKPKVLNVVEDDERRLQLMGAYREAETKDRREYKYLEEVLVPISKVPADLTPYLHVHFWGVPLPKGVCLQDVAIALERPSVNVFENEYIKTLIPEW